MADDPKDSADQVPEKYRQTNPEEAHRGHVPGERLRFRDPKNRKRVMGRSGDSTPAPGTNFDPFNPTKDEG